MTTAQSLLDITEVVLGKILVGETSPNAVDLNEVDPAYTEIFRYIKERKDWTRNDLLVRFGPSMISTAETAVDRLNGSRNADWPTILKRTYIKHDVASRLDSATRRLKSGMDIDIPELIQTISRLTTNQSSFIRMSEVEEGDMNLIKTGFKPLDYWIGGVPEAGLVTVAAPPKSGKTTFLAGLTGCYAELHKEKSAFIVTREMLEKQFKKRTREVMPNISAEAMERIILCHEVSSVSDVADKAATVGEELGLIGVDFADLLISGTVDPSKMEEVYRVLALLANQLHVPVVLLAQLAGGYKGGIPRPYHARWTRMAEALTWLWLSLYNPAKDYYAEKEKGLKIYPGQGFIVPWFCRSATNTELPGAIRLKLDGKTGWSNTKGEWVELDGNPNKPGPVDEDETIKDNNWDEWDE